MRLISHQSTTCNVELFEKRYNKGYNLYDPDYLSWLEVNHPDAVPVDRHSFTSVGTCTSVVEEFTHVTSC